MDVASSVKHVRSVTNPKEKLQEDGSLARLVGLKTICSGSWECRGRLEHNVLHNLDVPDPPQQVTIFNTPTSSDHQTPLQPAKPAHQHNDGCSQCRWSMSRESPKMQRTFSLNAQTTRDTTADLRRVASLADRLIRYRIVSDHSSTLLHAY